MDKSLGRCQEAKVWAVLIPGRFDALRSVFFKDDSAETEWLEKQGREEMCRSFLDLLLQRVLFSVSFSLSVPFSVIRFCPSVTLL